MQNILLITENVTYLMTSVQKKLEEASYNLIIVKPDMDEISKVKEDISTVLLYADADFMCKPQVLIYIKDKALEDDLPIFVIGDDEEVREVEKTIPKHLIQKEFKRPINVTELVDTVDEYVKNCGKHNKKKILVVDDSGAMLRNVKGWLEGKYHVILANSGAMAIKYLAMNRPDLVLLDYEMPVVDGKQVLEMIRTETEFADIPVIFLTSKGDRESVMKVMALKPEGYLLKTMEPQEIVKSVDEFFEKRKMLISGS